MDQNEQLIVLFQALINDPKVTAQLDWQKIIMVGSIEGSTRMAGYSFDTNGNFKPVSPDLDAMLAFRQLQKSMKIKHPEGLEWKACLLRIDRDGNTGADFEYTNAARWDVTPNNLEQSIAEFAAMPV